MSSLLKQLFSDQQLRINYFFDHIDLQMADKVLQLMHNCQGMIVLTGVGKSGLVAKKIATSLTSINVRALYLSPMDALHGDIGILSDKDVFILISKSGESEELLHLVPSLRNKGVKLVALVSDKNSHLGKASDLEMVLPLHSELCRFGLMPTTSSAIQMIFGDVLATALMELKDLKLEEYRVNHPAGRIGKRMTLKVKDLMLRGDAIPFCKPDDRVMDILVNLSNKRCGCMVVVDPAGELLGVFTDGDLRRTILRFNQAALEKRIEEVMTKTPRSISSDTLAFDAMKQMELDQKNPITVLPVLEGKKVVGLIKMHDIIQSGV